MTVSFFSSDVLSDEIKICYISEHHSNKNRGATNRLLHNSSLETNKLCKSDLAQFVAADRSRSYHTLFT